MSILVCPRCKCKMVYHDSVHGCRCCTCLYGSDGFSMLTMMTNKAFPPLVLSDEEYERQTEHKWKEVKQK